MAMPVLICGVPFTPLYHRDGRFMRAAGLFAFAKVSAGRHTVLHLELTEGINQVAGPSHRRWGWALAQGLNELLICPASTPMSMTDLHTGTVVDWHPNAEVWFGEMIEAAADLNDQAMIALAGSRR